MKAGISKIILLVLTASLVLAGCSDADEESETVQDAAGDEETVTQSEDESSAGADDADLETISIGFPSSGNDWAGGVAGVAYVEGYLEEYLNPLGYTAEMNGFVGAAPAIHEALVSEDLDYVVYAGMAGVLGKANDIDTTLLGVTAWTSNWRLIVSADSGIETLEDLAGKSIAYQRGASPQMYMLRVLNEGGVDYEDVEGVNMTIPDGMAAVATGSVDAAVVAAGQEAELVEEGTAVVLHKGFEADPDEFYETTVLIGRTAVVEENEDVGVAIMKALLKAKDKIAEDPDAYYELSAEQSGSPLDVVLATAEEDEDIAFPMNLEEKYVDSLKDIEVFLTENELITGTVDYDDWVNYELIERAIEEYSNEK